MHKWVSLALLIITDSFNKLTSLPRNLLNIVTREFKADREKQVKIREYDREWN